MKASEVVSVLQGLIGDYGDREITVFIDGDTYDVYAVDDDSMRESFNICAYTTLSRNTKHRLIQREHNAKTSTQQDQGS